MNDINVIEIKGLKKSYENRQITALNGIDLEIKEGEFVSIIGPSGSGKSTLLNMIGALDTPDEGSINVAGTDLTRKEDLSKFRSDEIGFVFQLHNLIPNLTVLENVQIPLIETPISDENTEKRALDLLKSVNLENKINQKPTKLSGGERQRVAIARSLAVNPPIILADEPTGNLDTKTGNYILDFLNDLHEREGKTIIIVTHDLDIVKYATRVVYIRDGEIEKIEKRTKKELNTKNEPNLN